MKPYYSDTTTTLYHGDCRQILPTLQPTGSSHVITDPPYARDVYVRMGSYATQAEKPNRHGIVKMAHGAIGSMNQDQIRDFAADMARHTDGWCIVFSDVESIHQWRDALGDAGLRYIRTGAWVKPDAMPQMTGDRPAVGFEPCTIMHSIGSPLRWNGGGTQAVWTFGTCKVDRPNHPCPKPLKLMSRLVQLFTNPGDTIVDPFAGSGTTLRAAKNLGRKSIGIEIDEKFCEVTARRMQQEVLL